MNKIKKTYISSKNFVNRHKTAIVVTSLAVTTAGTVLMVRNQKQFNEFLEEKGLTDEFYAIPGEE